MPTAAEPFGTVRDRAVYLPAADTVVAADLHLGRAAAAVDAPVGDGPAMVDRLLGLIDRFEPAALILAGDVLDAFDTVPREARATLASLRTEVSERGIDLVVVGGNHDVQLGPLLGDDPRQCHELVDGTVVCHGHEVPPSSGRRYVLGHDHPTIDIDGRRRPCFLYGPGAYEGADVLVLPAFNPALPGTAVNTWRAGDPLSPVLADPARLHPVVWDDQTGSSLTFPALRALQPYL